MFVNQLVIQEESGLCPLVDDFEGNERPVEGRVGIVLGNTRLLRIELAGHQVLFCRSVRQDFAQSPVGVAVRLLRPIGGDQNPDGAAALGEFAFEHAVVVVRLSRVQTRIAGIVHPLRF